MEPVPKGQAFMNLNEDERLGDTNGASDAGTDRELNKSDDKLQDLDPSSTVNSQKSVNGSSSSWCGLAHGDLDRFIQSSRQEILLDGSDAHNSHAVYGQLVEVVPSEASLSSKAAAGSNKVKINPVVNFDWEHKFYTGNLVTVHLNQTHIAYVLRGKSGGIVRVTNRRTAERILLKNFSGLVVDVSFAFTSRIVLGVVDEPGNMYVYEIFEGADGKMKESLMLHVIRPTGTPPTDFHRIIWCCYIPDDSATDAGYSDESMFLLLTHSENAELWHVGKAQKQLKSPGPVLPSQVTTGLYEIHSHVKPITDAVFSPDGTAVATASQDGFVKFFKFDVSSEDPPVCIHQWQPHQGHPLTSLFFLDDHKHHNSDEQLWKFVITGADYNSEMKIWSCQTWTCLQTIHFSAPNELGPPCHIKACLDLSASYLVLSDINRQVLYILELYQDHNLSQAHVCSLSEFLLMQPCLSFSILDAGRRRLGKEALAYSDEHVWSCTTGEIGSEENGEEVELDVSQPDVGVLVRLYAVHTRAMQELQIRFVPQSSVPKRSCESASSAVTDVGSSGAQDHLSDASLASDYDRVTDRLLHLQSSPDRDSLSTVEPSPNRSLPSQPFLLTPDAFISPRHPDSLTASTVSDSLTLVTALEDDSHRTSSINLIPSSVKNISTDSAEMFPDHFANQKSAKVGNSKSVDPFDPRLSYVSSVASNHFRDSRQSSDSPASLVVEKEGEQDSKHAFLKRLGEHSRRSSSGSSSSASLEVNSILGSHVRPGRGLEADVKLEHVDEITSSRLVKSNTASLDSDGNQLLEGDNSEQVVASGGLDDDEEEEEDDVDDDEDGDSDNNIIEIIDDIDNSVVEAVEDDRKEVRRGSLQEWPQAAGVIDVSDVMHLTGDANRRSLENSNFAKTKHIATGKAGFLSEPVSSSSQLARTNSPDKQSRSSPSSLPRNETNTVIMKSMGELLELIQLQKQELEMLRSEVRQQRNWVDAVERLEHQVDSLSEVFNTKLANALSEHTRIQHEKLYQAMQDLSGRNHSQFDELVANVVRIVQDSLKQQVDVIIKSEMQKTVLPHMESCLEPLKGQFYNEVSQKLSAIESVLKDTVSRTLRSKPTVEAISQAAANEMRDSFVGVYKNTVIPSFDRCCQDVMQQLSSVFQKGSLEYIQHMETNTTQIFQKMEDLQKSSSQQLQGVTEAFRRTDDTHRQAQSQLTDLVGTLQSSLAQHQQNLQGDEQQLKTRFNELQQTLSDQVKRILTDQVTHLLQEQQTVLNDQLQNALRSGAATPIHPFGDPQQQVLTLVRQGKYDIAFQQALSATDLALVEYVCENADPGLVFSPTSSSPLGQPILLSLIQQLSANLSTKTELKHRYLEEAILNLDQTSHVTKEHLALVINQLCSKLGAFVRSADPRDKIYQPMARLLRVCELLLRAQNK